MWWWRRSACWVASEQTARTTMANKAWPHNTKRIYNVDPYYKTAMQIHNCLVRACLVMLNLSVTVNRTKKQNSKPGFCKCWCHQLSSPTTEVTQWLMIENASIQGNSCSANETSLPPMSHEIKRKSKWNSSTFSPFCRFWWVILAWKSY